MIRVLFLVNGESSSAAAIRARAFVSALAGDIDARLEYRSRSRIAAIIRFAIALLRSRPDVAYVVDMSYSGIVAVGLCRPFLGFRIITDTGDAIGELARSVGKRGPVGLWLTDRLERFGFWLADAIVVRGTLHRKLLEGIGKPVVVVQDGVNTSTFRPTSDASLRESLAQDGALTVGLVGSSVWSERLGFCYGWEIVEVVHLLRDRGIIGIVVGAGSGIVHLRERAATLGVEDRLRFVGHIAYDDLPRYLGAMDICLSTQTNDIAGRVRTTGKLPLYLAAGGIVLATRVGEASLCLAEDQLVDYYGTIDHDYPARLAGRIDELLSLPDGGKELVAQNRLLAKERFEYADLSRRILETIQALFYRR